ncbi:MAG: hypothetical protein M1814_004117 [Vezdaea aestivalis]|nr:MAG: hypothetical protein M1814_004117 [Vezdaea aestivalis]
MVVYLAFSLHDTLLDTQKMTDDLEETLECGEQSARRIAAEWRKNQLEYTWRMNSMGIYKPFSEVMQGALKAAVRGEGVIVSDRQCEDLMHSMNQSHNRFKNVDQTISKLEKRKDLVLLIFSNSNYDMASNIARNWRGSMKKSPFQHIVTPDTVKVFKPARQFYDHLKGVLRSRPDSGGESMDLIYLISANPSDIVGANAADPNTLWFNRKGKRTWVDEMDANSKPDCEIWSWKRLETVKFKEIALKENHTE